MGIQQKTPGVYVKELRAFPNTVVEVPTAIPVFIGLTEFAASGPLSLFGVPTRISSMSDYHTLFGDRPPTRFSLPTTYDPGNGFAVTEPGLDKDHTHGRNYLFYSLAMFFANGGGPCYIVSVGDYDTSFSDLKQKILDSFDVLLLEHEPTLVVIPDAVSLSSAEWQEISQESLAHCARMQSRFAILDVWQGDAAVTPANKVIENFRNAITAPNLDYGAAYYPWIHTSMLSDGDIDPSFLDDDSLDLFTTKLTAITRDNTLTRDAMAQPLRDLIAVIKDGPKQKPASPPPAPPLPPPGPSAQGQTAQGQSATPPAGPPAQSAGATTTANAAPNASPSLSPDDYKARYHRAHTALAASMPAYKDVMVALRDAMNLMPPSGAIAGVYAWTDAERGVFKAPAGTGIIGAVRPAVNLTNEMQEDLNVPLDGKAINAIRSFPGDGLLVWGARTLDGNSQDTRYINVRRTLIMLEQSIAIAARAYVFEPNTASTWVSVRGTIENFLTNQWKAGALAGATPAEAFDVSVGLNVTMTGNDVLDGYMNVTVHVAVVRPAEFIVITFQQKMQTS